MATFVAPDLTLQVLQFDPATSVVSPFVEALDLAADGQTLDVAALASWLGQRD